MTAVALIGLYVAVGAAAGVVAFVARRAGAVTSVLLVPLWPLLGPGVFQVAAREDPLVALARTVRAQLGPSAGDRERRAIDGLLTHLLERRRRLAAIGAAGASVPDKLRPRLDVLAQRLQADLDTGRSLLEELSAQLTLVALSGVGETPRHAADRMHVEALVAGLESLVGGDAVSLHNGE